MKNKKGIISVILLICAIFCSFTSCSDKSSTSNNNVAIRCGRSAVYNGMCYSFHGTSITSIDCENDIEPLPLCSDPLCSHKYGNCSAYVSNDFSRFMLVDKVGSDKNGKHAIIYAAFVDADGKNVIARFDTKTNTKKVIVEDTFYVNKFWLYDNMLYYSDDTSLNVLAYDMNNNTEYKLNNADDVRYKIGGIDEQYVYIVDYSGKLYRCPRDLSSLEYIRDTVDRGQVYVSDTAIYFAQNVHVGVVVDGMNFMACDLYSVDKNDLTAEPKLVIENISYITCPIVFQSGADFFYCTCENIELVREYDVTDPYDGNTQKRKAYKDGTQDIYRYDTLTGESKLIMEDNQYSLYTFCGSDERYMVYWGALYDDLNITTVSGGDTMNVVIDFKTGKQYVYSIR